MKLMVSEFLDFMKLPVGSVSYEMENGLHTTRLCLPRVGRPTPDVFYIPSADFALHANKFDAEEKRLARIPEYLTF